MTAPLAVFRADASAAIGGGHIVRCVALAEALREAGWRTALATRPDTIRTVPAAGTMERIALPEGRPGEEPTALADALPDGCDLLVVDHYGWTRAEEQVCRRFARRVAVLDDFAAAPHDADIVLDPTPGRSPSTYAGLVRPDAALLAGAAWAPLRRAIAEARAARPRTTLRRLLVTLGMTDPANATGRVLAALGASGVACDIDVLLGSSAPHREAVAAMLPANATLHLDPPDLPAIVVRADLAIGAGGVSALERACLGVPSLLVEIADNQRPAIAGLVAAGAGRALGRLAALDDRVVAEAIRALASDGAELATLSQAALRVCDGLGALRAATWLAPERTRDGAPVSLRPAGPEDEALLLAWQSVPGARAHARNPAIPSAEEHHAWLHATLADPLRILSVVMCARQPAAMLRLDRDGTGKRYEVSILVAPTHQRRGIGAAALGLAGRLLPGSTLVAEVSPQNLASVALFRGAGFQPVSPSTWERSPRLEHRAA